MPDLPRWSEYEGRKTLSGRMGRDAHVTLVESVRQDRPAPASRCSISATSSSAAGERHVSRFSLTFRTVSVPQMSSLLERAGFRVDAVLGDYQGGPWDERADVWVILASRR